MLQARRYFTSGVVGLRARMQTTLLPLKRRFGTSGATAIEYAIIAGAVALGIVAAVFSVGDLLLSLFQQIVAGFN